MVSIDFVKELTSHIVVVYRLLQRHRRSRAHFARQMRARGVGSRRLPRTPPPPPRTADETCRARKGGATCLAACTQHPSQAAPRLQAETSTKSTNETPAPDCISRNSPKSRPAYSLNRRAQPPPTRLPREDATYYSTLLVASRPIHVHVCLARSGHAPFTVMATPRMPRKAPKGTSRATRELASRSALVGSKPRASNLCCCAAP